MAANAPAGSNTYIPSYDATGGLIAFTRNANAFRLNQYVKYLKVKKDQGYYLTLDADEPARVVDLDDYLWADGADAASGNGEKQEFQYTAFRTVRYNFPFNVGYKAAAQADWPIIQAHAMKTLAKSMTLRTMKAASLLTTSGNYSGNTAAASGAWSTSSTANTYIQADIQTGLLVIEQATNGILYSEDSFVIVMSPTVARNISKSPEYRAYIQGSPDALSYLTDQTNPNRVYGLAPRLYGIKVVVEHATKVTTRKGGSQTRGFVWPDTAVAIVSRPEGLVGTEGTEFSDFSTCAFRFYEEQTVETKDDPDNRRHQGRVVEDYIATLQAPTTGYLITGVS